AHFTRGGLDLDAPIATADLQGHIRSDARLLPDCLGNDQAARRINGNSNGTFHGIHSTTIIESRNRGRSRSCGKAPGRVGGVMMARWLRSLPAVLEADKRDRAPSSAPSRRARYSR